MHIVGQKLIVLIFFPKTLNRPADLKICSHMFGTAFLPTLIRFSDYIAYFYVANLRPPIHTITMVTAHSLLTADIS